MVRTIVPLRIIGIISIVFFIGYGALAGAVATFLLYLLSLPINIIRLRQMLNLVKKARVSAQGDLSMDWLRPFMTPRKYKKGDVLFHKGDVAKEMFLTVSGTFLVKEIGIELPPGRIMGELGFIDPKNRRTGTVESLEDGEVLTITYDRLLELYFQNPEFGYYLPAPDHRAPDAEHRAAGRRPGGNEKLSLRRALASMEVDSRDACQAKALTDRTHPSLATIVPGRAARLGFASCIHERIVVLGIVVEQAQPAGACGIGQPDALLPARMTPAELATAVPHRCRSCRESPARHPWSAPAAPDRAGRRRVRCQ